jgi:hypothetical protein
MLPFCSKNISRTFLQNVCTFYQTTQPHNPENKSPYRVSVTLSLLCIRKKQMFVPYSYLIRKPTEERNLCVLVSVGKVPLLRPVCGGNKEVQKNKAELNEVGWL